MNSIMIIIQEFLKQDPTTQTIPVIFITAIADVFDALTTERPYKKAWTIDDALNLIKNEADEHFDPELVKKFLEIMPEILKLKDKYAEQTN